MFEAERVCVILISSVKHGKVKYIFTINTSAVHDRLVDSLFSPV